jgi:hypothetical protein
MLSSADNPGTKKAAGDGPAYAVSAIAGLMICLAITQLTGRNEAWDAQEYFSIGIPLMCVVVFAVSYRYPRRPWRWALSMALGQSVAMVLGGGSASLWPLAIIAMTVVSLPQFIVAMIAAAIAKKMMPPDGPGS